MHFRLPKPLHGWREFAGEVGIIVVGVLIALAAEQVVEKISWDYRANGATDSLREEVGFHYIDASEAVIAQPCIDAQLKGLEAGLEKNPYTSAKAYSEDQFVQFVYRAPSRPWSDNKWAAIVGEGVASHLNKDLRRNLGDHYAQVAIMRENNRATDQLGWRLNVLTGTWPIDPATRGELAQEIEEARGRFAYMRVVGNQIIARIRLMKLTPSDGYLAAVADSGTLKFCRAHHLPLAAVEAKD